MTTKEMKHEVMTHWTNLFASRGTGRLLLALSGLLFASATVGAADAEVARLSRSQALTFVGNKAFTDAQLRSGLMSSFEFLLASHPLGNRSNYLATLPELIGRGYRDSGFPDVRVTASIDEVRQRTHVAISEGVRFRMADLQIRSAKTIPVDALKKRLTEEVQGVITISKFGEPGEGVAYLDRQGKEVRPQPALWKAGEPCSFAQTPEMRAVQIELVLNEFGYFFARVKASLERREETGTVDLLVEVLDEGPHGVIAGIDIVGNRNNSRADVLKLLGVTPGMPVENDMIARLERKLWDSARFIRYTVTPAVLPSQTNAIQLVVTVQELTNAPSLNEPLSREQQAALKFRQWLINALQKEDMVVSAQMTNMPPGFEEGRGVISQQGIALKFSANRTASASHASLALLMSSNRFVWFSPGTNRKLLVTASTNLSFSLSIALQADASCTNDEAYRLTVFGGFGASRADEKAKTQGASFHVDWTLAPSAFMREACRVSQSSWDGEDVTMISDMGKIGLNAVTGRLIRLEGTQEAARFDVTFTPGEYAKVAAELESMTAAYPNSYDPEHPASSSLGFIAGEVLSSPLVKPWLWKNAPEDARARSAEVLRRILTAGVFAPFDALVRASPGRDGVFMVPPKDPETLPQAMETMGALLAATVFRFADDAFPENSWPWIATREAVFVFAGKPAYTDRELARLYDSAEVGPIGFLILSRLLNFARLPAAKKFAVRGLDRLALADFQKDSRFLIEGTTAITASFTNVLRTVQSVSDADVDAVAAVLPAEGVRLWRETIRSLRKTAQPGAAFAADRLDELWETSLRAQIAKALTNSAGEALAIAAAEQPFAAGLKYFNGDGVKQNHAEAVKLFHEAASHGHPGAEYWLAVCYEQGLAVERSVSAATQWYRRAAEHGVAPAQARLGSWLSDGLTLPANYEEAYVWLRLAALQGDRVSAALSTGVFRKLTPEQFEQAQKRIVELTQKGMPWNPGRG